MNLPLWRRSTKSNYQHVLFCWVTPNKVVEPNRRNSQINPVTMIFDSYLSAAEFGEIKVRPVGFILNKRYQPKLAHNFLFKTIGLPGCSGGMRRSAVHYLCACAVCKLCPCKQACRHLNISCQTDVELRR